MREDIAKVIVERPRSGSSGQLSKEYRREVAWSRLCQEEREEDSPGRESIRRKWGFDRKEFNDYLAPIKGFLRKSVGRPWNDVWSEIASRLSLGSTTQRHVLEHARDYVEINTIEQEDGSITNSRGLPLRNRRRDSFYACPRTGLLLETPDREYKSSRRHRWGPEVPLVRFHRVNGIWFDVSFAKPPVVGKGWEIGGQVFSTREKLGEWLTADDGRRSFYRAYVREVDLFMTVRDALLGRMAEISHRYVLAACHWRDGGDIYCVEKRQAGKQEIRRFGLRAPEAILDGHGGPVVEV